MHGAAFSGRHVRIFEFLWGAKNDQFCVKGEKRSSVNCALLVVKHTCLSTTMMTQYSTVEQQKPCSASSRAWGEAVSQIEDVALLPRFKQESYSSLCQLSVGDDCKVTKYSKFLKRLKKDRQDNFLLGGGQVT